MDVWSEDRQIEKARDELVVKDNRLLQTITRRKNKLTAREQKAVGYLLSMIKPDDKYRHSPFTYIFDIHTFCDICGINHNSGSNLQAVKETLQALASNGFWLQKNQYFQWIAAPEIKDSVGQIEVEIPSKIFPYLVGLTEKFTQYELWQILPLKSTYSIALFELLKSYAYKHTVVLSLEQLRSYLGIDDNKYKDFKNFKKKVLNTSQREINDLTDLTISWKGIRNGRFYTAIEFSISTKKNFDALEAYRRNKAILNGVKHTEGQINIFE